VRLAPVKKRARAYHGFMPPFARELAGSPLVVLSGEETSGLLPLARDEEQHAATLAHPKRREEWILGRLAAKEALARAGVPRTEEITVRADADGAPRGFARGEPLPHGLSISHGHGLAVAWALERGLPGVDLERVRPRPEGTFRFYLEPGEREPLLALEGAERDRAAVVLWSLKEAVWKTLRPHRGIALLDFALGAVDARAPSGEVLALPREKALELARARSISRIHARFVVQGELVFSWAWAD